MTTIQNRFPGRYLGRVAVAGTGDLRQALERLDGVMLRRAAELGRRLVGRALAPATCLPALGHV